MSDGREGSFKRIKALNCIQTVQSMLKLRDTLRTIADYIQKDQKEMLDITTGSLVSILGRYRKAFMTPSDLHKEDMVDRYGSKADEFINGLIEIDELSKLYALQMKRIGVGMELEEKLHFLDKKINIEIDLALRILKKSHDIKMDLGVGGGRNLGTMGIRPEFSSNLETIYGSDVLDTFNNPDSRSKVFSAMKVLLVDSGMSDIIDSLDEDSEIEPEDIEDEKV